MKKRILLTLLASSMLIFIFAVSVSAVELITSTSNEFGTVNNIEGVNEGYTLQDKTSRVVLVNADGSYSTFPAYYISDVKLQYQGTVKYNFEFLNAALGLTGTEDAYDMDSIIRVEILTDSTVMNNNGGDFRNRTNLKEVVFPAGTKLTKLNQQQFKGSAIEKICIPASVTEIGTNLFESCASLEEVTFEEGFSMTTLPSGMFNGCTALKKVIFPNCVTGSSGSLFNKCGSLEELRFGANFTTYPSGGMSISNTAVIYAPDTFLSNITKINKGAFSSYTDFYAKTVTVFLVGDEDVAKALVAKASSFDYLKNATLIEYDSSKPDSYYIPENPTKWTIVYNYNKCKAFYAGEHETSQISPCVVECSNCNEKTVKHISDYESTVVEYVNGFAASGKMSCVCVSEGCTFEVNDELDPLFTVLGFSASLSGDMMSVNYRVNEEAIKEYEKITGEAVNYGVFAVKAETIGTNDIFDENGDERQGVIAADITDCGFNLFNLKIMGFDEEQKDIDLAMGAFVKTSKEGTVKYSYLQIDEPTNGKYYLASYNDVVALLKEENI